jgi:ABC-type uncharacterized transport system permease subunit
MQRKNAIFIWIGLAIGAIFGMMVGAAEENLIWGLALGALAGTFVGWFIAIALEQKSKSEKPGAQ